MKKLVVIIIIIILIIVLAVFLTACNKQIVDFNLKFTNAYIKVGDTWIDVEISKWTDYEGEQFQLTLKDGTVIVVSSINCILYNGKLPKGD